MSLWKQLILMACVLVGLILWDRQLSVGEKRSREDTGSVQPLVDGEVFADRPIAAVRVTIGEKKYLYAYLEGLWRCLGYNAVPAISSRVTALNSFLTAARGVVRTSNPEDAAAYGFGLPDSLRLTYCGQFVLQDPEGDIIFDIEVGHSIPGDGGSFIRVVNSSVIWAVDVDFRSPLGLKLAGENTLPPMVDPKVIPEEWGGFREGISAITIRKAGEPDIICTRAAANGDSDGAPQAPDWIILQGETQSRGIDDRFYRYTQFLSRIEFTGLPAEKTEAELGLDTPRGQVQLTTVTGKTLTLTLGGYGPFGGAVLHSDFSATLYEISRAAGDALLPKMSDLTQPTTSSPWDQWQQ